jgi:hypothetical protein
MQVMAVALLSPVRAAAVGRVRARPEKKLHASVDSKKNRD